MHEWIVWRKFKTFISAWIEFPGSRPSSGGKPLNSFPLGLLDGRHLGESDVPVLQIAMFCVTAKSAIHREQCRKHCWCIWRLRKCWSKGLLVLRQSGPSAEAILLGSWAVEDLDTFLVLAKHSSTTSLFLHTFTLVLTWFCYDALVRLCCSGCDDVVPRLTEIL